MNYKKKYFEQKVLKKQQVGGWKCPGIDRGIIEAYNEVAEIKAAYSRIDNAQLKHLYPAGTIPPAEAVGCNDYTKLVYKQRIIDYCRGGVVQFNYTLNGDPQTRQLYADSTIQELIDEIGGGTYTILNDQGMDMRVTRTIIGLNNILSIWGPQGGGYVPLKYMIKYTSNKNTNYPFLLNL